MKHQQTCPRCGDEFVGDDRSIVASAVVDHALTEHRHRLDREIVLAHLDNAHPHESDT